MAIAYRARALGPLRAIDWAIPAGVSVVVGPNRVGKSTLLRVPQLISSVIMIGVNEAFKMVFEGVPQRNLSMPSSTPITLGLAGNRIEWELDLVVQGGQVAHLPSERLVVDGEVTLWRELGSVEIEGKGVRHPWPVGVIPSLAITYAKSMAGDTMPTSDPGWKAFAHLPGRITADAPDVIVRASQQMFDEMVSHVPVSSYCTYLYEINHLLRFGSLQSSAKNLQRNGSNLFPLLRNWRDVPQLEERYEFVLATMREIFPHLGRMGFESAGQTVTMNVSDRRWPGNASIPIARESTGFITALLQLCALVSCEPNSLVTLDEIETSLHPRAIRVLVDACRTWAAKHDLRVVLATQSETVLDQFRDEPSQVFVLEPNQDTSPKALTDLFSPEYLSQFSLGDLFAHLEFGSDPTDD